MSDINQLTQEVADLTTATTSLIGEVAGQKEVLATSAQRAESKANEAFIYANRADDSQSSSADSASEAQASADRAAQIAGLETVSDAVSYELDNRGYELNKNAIQQAKTSQSTIQTQAILGKIHPLY